MRLGVFILLLLSGERNFGVRLNKPFTTSVNIYCLCLGVFILLLLSGERNFGVRLNKPFTATVPMDIPVFAGSHADLLIIVFHKVSWYLMK